MDHVVVVVLFPENRKFNTTTFSPCQSLDNDRKNKHHTTGEMTTTYRKFNIFTKNPNQNFYIQKWETRHNKRYKIYKNSLKILDPQNKKMSFQISSHFHGIY